MEAFVIELSGSYLTQFEGSIIKVFEDDCTTCVKASDFNQEIASQVSNKVTFFAKSGTRYYLFIYAKSGPGFFTVGTFDQDCLSNVDCTFGGYCNSDIRRCTLCDDNSNCESGWSCLSNSICGKCTNDDDCMIIWMRKVKANKKGERKIWNLQ